MEPALDEASLIPCPTTHPADRITRLAGTLRALDQLGVPRVLRSVRDAADRDIGGGRGLRQWCFDLQTPRDDGRFLAMRLDKAPFIDGANGLFTAIEGGRAIHPTIDGILSLGGGHVALTEGVLTLLSGSTWPTKKPVVVRIEAMTEEDEWTDEVLVDAVDSAAEVRTLADTIGAKVDASVTGGPILWERLPELFPRLVVGERAAEQLILLTGSEPFFPQVLRHLRALNRAALSWKPGLPFSPEGVTFSVESEATLKDGKLGPLRDFPTPPEFSAERWTLHTKLTGGNGARLYYKPQEFVNTETEGEPKRKMLVAVGYLGPHLATVRYR